MIYTGTNTSLLSGTNATMDYGLTTGDLTVASSKRRVPELEGLVPANLRSVPYLQIPLVVEVPEFNDRKGKRATDPLWHTDFKYRN